MNVSGEVKMTLSPGSQWWRLRRDAAGNVERAGPYEVVGTAKHCSTLQELVICRSPYNGQLWADTLYGFALAYEPVEEKKI